MSAPSKAADAQRMLTTMQNGRISCFTCRHMEGYTHHKHRWCSKIQSIATDNTAQIAATCTHFLWDTSR